MQEQRQAIREPRPSEEGWEQAGVAPLGACYEVLPESKKPGLSAAMLAPSSRRKEA